MCRHCGKHFTYVFSLKSQQSYEVGVTVPVLERKLRLRDCSVGASSRNQTPGIRILAVPLISCVILGKLHNLPASVSLVEKEDNNGTYFSVKQLANSKCLYVYDIE